MRKFNKQPAEPGSVIGFTEKYYTWWIVSEPYTMNKWYGSQVVQDFTYQQNLSFEKDKAIQKLEERDDVKDFRINEDLRATSSYQWGLSEIEYKEDIFLFGKYREKKFSEVDDTQYKRWYWSETKGTEKESPVLKKQLENMLVEYDGETIFVDELKDKAMKVYEENFRRRGFFGQKGETYENYVRLRKNWGFDTHYGWMHCYEFVDPDGRLIYYKGSKSLDIDEDIVYTLKGKIKHTKYWSNYHNEYVEETQIQYPKIKKEKEL